MASDGVTLTGLAVTCSACPSQWEASDAEGNSYYVRYRWGYLQVVKNGICGKPIDDGEVIFGEQVGDDLDGFMDTPTMLVRTGMRTTIANDLTESRAEKVTEPNE